MRSFLPIMVKEFRHVLRDGRSLGVALALPLLLVVLFGYAINLDVTRVNVALVDRDHSAASREIVSHLAADGAVRIVARPESEAALETLLDRGKVHMGIVVPPGFEAGLAAGRDVPVQVLVDGSDASFAAQALAHVSGSVRSFTAREVRHALRMAGMAGDLPTLSAETRVFFNEALDSRWFVVPGLIAIILMMLSALITSQCVAREYERHTIEQVLVSPVTGPALMLGKLTPYLVMGVLQVASVTLASRFLFHVPIRGSLGLLAVATVLYLIGAQAMGLLFSAALKSQQVALQISFVATILPSILLSGFVFPITNMPWFLQVISYVVPARYYIEITRGLFLKGVGIHTLWPQFLAMVVFAFVILAAGVSRFRRSL